MKVSYRYLLLLLLLVTLYSCKVAKDYQRPGDVVTANSYRSDTFQGDSTSIAAIPWDAMFTDVLLQGYIRQALDSNFNIRISVQRLEEAQAYLKQARAGYTPQINAQATYSGVHPSKFSSLGTLGLDYINQYDIGANLSWEADIWGKIHNLKESAKAQYLMTDAAQKAVQTQLVASVASLYYQLLALDEQAAVAQSTVTSRQESLQTTQALKDAGMVTAAAVKQTEAQLYDAQITLLNLKKAITQTENAFCILLAESPRSVQRSTLSEQKINPALKIGVPSLLLANRPDVLAAEYNLISAFHLTKAAKASLYPSLTISLSGGLSALENNLFTPDALTGAVVAGILAPILNNRQLRTKYEIALSEKQIALLNFRQTFLTAVREVSDALLDYQTATETIVIQKKQVDALLLATDYSKQLLNNGMANYLEVLTAQQQALAAQLQLVNSNYRQLNSVVTLYKALGGGWK